MKFTATCFGSCTNSHSQTDKAAKKFCSAKHLILFYVSMFMVDISTCSVKKVYDRKIHLI